MVQRSLPFLVLAGLMSCKGDPTGDLRNGFDHATLSPSTLFVTEGTTGFVVVTAVDEQGNAVVGRFSAPSAVGPGITVTVDDSYLPVYDSKGNLVPPSQRTAVRYAVHADANTANSSFAITVSGEPHTIPVRIIPAAVAVVTSSSAAPVPGDTITLTAPAPYLFTPASVATAGAATLFKVALSADSTQLKVVPPAGVNGPISISNTVLSYATGATFLTVTTNAAVVTPAARLALNKTTFAIGDTLVATAPPGYRFIAGPDTVSIGGGTFGKIGISTDSTQMRLLIGPNNNDQVRIAGMRIRGLPTQFGPFALRSDSIVSPVVANFAGTFSNATPAVDETVTITAPATMRFLPTATLANGGGTPLIISRSADSTQIVFAPSRGTTGPVTVTGVVFSALKSVSLTLPTVASLTPPAPRAGTGAIATAPTIPLPAVGGTTTIFDGGGFSGDNSVSGGVGNKFYKITVPAATSVTVNLRWTNTADIDILYGLADGSDFLNCFAGATGANPEQATCTLPAGDTILFANLFSGSPPGVLRITLTRNN